MSATYFPTVLTVSKPTAFDSCHGTGVHLLSGTLVAIKVINPLQRPNAERARKLFVREVKLHAVVSGLPGVVR